MALDPVEVLCHLKALGYENIDPHLLQKFMKDLKKLIKYEKSRTREKENEGLKIESQQLTNDKNLVPNHNCTNACCTKKNNDVFQRLSRHIPKTKLCSKAVSSVAVQTDIHFKQNKNDKYSQILKRKQMDPVSLHQYYQSEWQTHKVPGEKNHDQLRWQIRQMMNRK